jgi:chromosome segregation ATPase
MADVLKSRRQLRRENRDLHAENAALSRRERALTAECQRHQEQLEGLRQQVISATRAAVAIEGDTVRDLRQQLADRDTTIRGLAEELATAMAVVEARFEPDAEGWSAEDELRVTRQQNKQLEQKVADLQAANESMEIWRKAPKQVAS